MRRPWLLTFGLLCLFSSQNSARALPSTGTVVWPNSGGSLTVHASSSGVFNSQVVLPVATTAGTLTGDRKAVLASANVRFGPYTVSLKNTNFPGLLNGSPVNHTFTVAVYGAPPGQVASNSPLTLTKLGEVTKTLTADFQQTSTASLFVTVVMPSVFMDVKVVATFSPGPYGRPDAAQFPKSLTYPSTACGRVTPGLLSPSDDCMQGAISPTGVLVPEIMPLSIIHEPPGNCSWSNMQFGATVGSAMSVSQAQSTATNTLWNYSALGGVFSDSSNTTQTIVGAQASASIFSSTTTQAFGTATGLPLMNPGNPSCNAGIPVGDTSSLNGPGVGDQFVFVVQPNLLYWDTSGLTSFRLAKNPVVSGTQPTIGNAFVRQIDPKHMNLRPSFMAKLSETQMKAIRSLDPFAPDYPTSLPDYASNSPLAATTGKPLPSSRYVYLYSICPSAGSPMQVNQGSVFDHSTKSKIDLGYQEIQSSNDAVNMALPVAAIAGIAAFAVSGDVTTAFETFGKVNEKFDKVVVSDVTTTTVNESVSTNTSWVRSQANSYAQSFLVKDQAREMNVDLYYDTFFGTLAFNPATRCNAPRTGGWDMEWGDSDSRWLVDVNGDGFSDFCRGFKNSSGAGGSIACSLSTSGGTIRGTPDFTVSMADMGASELRWFADVNNDGKSDFCRAVNGASSIACSLSHGTGMSSGFDTLSPVSDWGFAGRRWFVDVNGDGRADLCRAVGNYSGFNSFLGCSFTNPSTLTLSPSFDLLSPVADWGYPDRRWFVDINNDKKMDFCRAVGNSSGNDSFLGCSITTTTSAGGAMNLLPVADWGPADRRFMADVNGDGSAELCLGGPTSAMTCTNGTTTQIPDWGYGDRRWLSSAKTRGEFCRAVGNSSGPQSFIGCQIF